MCISCCFSAATLMRRYQSVTAASAFQLQLQRNDDGRSTASTSAALTAATACASTVATPQRQLVLSRQHQRSCSSLSGSNDFSDDAAATQQRHHQEHLSNSSSSDISAKNLLFPIAMFQCVVTSSDAVYSEHVGLHIRTVPFFKC